MPIPVKAKQLGFYGTKLRYEGEEFEVRSITELGAWMERQDGGPNRGEDGFDEALAAASKPATDRKPSSASSKKASDKAVEAASKPATDDEAGASQSNQTVI